MREVPLPVCPEARFVEGATPADGGCVCGVMEHDQKRADPLLEGAPVGVFIRLAEDPSTYFNFCAGAGEPLADPDDLINRAFGMGHYTGCPIYAAARELDHLDRLFKPPERPDTSDEHTGPQEFTAEEVEWLAGESLI